MDVCNASYGLFKIIMAYDNLTEQDWKAARFAIYGAFQGIEVVPSSVGEINEILKFLTHHLCLHGVRDMVGGDHGTSIVLALKAVVLRSSDYRADPLTAGYIGHLNRTSPAFVNGVHSTIRPGNPFLLRMYATGLIALTTDQWFNSPEPVMAPEEMSEFCEDLAVFIIDDHFQRSFVQKCSAIILFGMLRSPEWRKHIVTRFWRMFAYCTLVNEEWESFGWCLQNATELLEFTRGLADGEGLKWWYGALWFHYDKLDTTAREEVEKVAREMSSGDGLSDLNLYLNLIGEEVTKTRQEVDELHKAARSELPGVEFRARLRLIALEGNHDRLAQIAGLGRR